MPDEHIIEVAILLKQELYNDLSLLAKKDERDLNREIVYMLKEYVKFRKQQDEYKQKK